MKDWLEILFKISGAVSTLIVFVLGFYITRIRRREQRRDNVENQVGVIEEKVRQLRHEISHAVRESELTPELTALKNGHNAQEQTIKSLDQRAREIEVGLAEIRAVCRTRHGDFPR